MAKSITINSPKYGTQYATVDDSDYDNVSKYSWFANVKGIGRRVYAVRCFWSKNKPKSVYLHTFIMNTPIGFVVDHIDGNPLNCQRSNMRVCSVKDNSRNRRKTKNKKSSKFLGVFWNKQSNSWCASISPNKIQIRIGNFKCEVEAAKAYDKAAKEHYGQFANLNFK